MLWPPRMLQTAAVCTRMANRTSLQEIKMADVTEVRRIMVDESGVVVDELDYITDAVITARVRAVEIDPSPAVLTGNRLISDGTVWTWEDAPDNACGHTRVWSHVKKSGDSYGYTGKCSDGSLKYEVRIA